jgi:hypothetical protein
MKGPDSDLKMVMSQDVPFGGGYMETPRGTGKLNSECNNYRCTLDALTNTVPR